MITYEMIKEAQDCLVECWGEDGKKVIAECAKVAPLNIDYKTFLKDCTMCGGNWGGMLLTGINHFYPNVWDVIPNEMGAMAWSCLCYTLILMGVDISV